MATTNKKLKPVYLWLTGICLMALPLMAWLYRQPAVQPVNLPADMPAHPRLLVNSVAAFKEIAKEAGNDPFIGQSHANIMAEADKLLPKTVTRYPKKVNRSVGYQNKQVYARTFTLCYAYRVTGEKKYADRLWQELKEAGSFPDWGNKHFLDVAEMTYAFSIAYDWLYDAWTPEQRTLLKQAIVNKALIPGKKFYDNVVPKGWFNWGKVNHNWNQVCNGALIVGALAVGDEEPELSQYILTKAVINIKRAMKLYAPDGGWMEGTSYLSYALRYNIAAIASLETATGSTQGLADMPGLDGTGKFIVSMAGPTGLTFNFADCKERVVTSAELFWLAKKFNQSYLVDFEKRYSTRQSPIELIWYMKAKNLTAAKLPLGNYFRTTEAASMISSRTDSDALFVAVKGGKNGVNHGHLDAGTFVLDGLGERWVMDMGSDSYDLEGYFSAKTAETKRWQYFKTTTQGHNTLLINDRKNTPANLNQKLTTVSRITQFNAEGSRGYALIDLTSAYRYTDNSPLTSVKRGVMLNSDEVIVQDEVTAQSAIDVTWQIYTRAGVSISADGKKATLSNGGKQMDVMIQGTQGAKFESAPAAPLPGTNVTAGTGLKNITRLFITGQNVQKRTLTVVFKQPGKAVIYSTKPLAQWN